MFTTLKLVSNPQEHAFPAVDIQNVLVSKIKPYMPITTLKILFAIFDCYNTK